MTASPPGTPNPLHTLAFPSALLPNMPQLVWPKNKDPGSVQWYWVDFTAWLAVVGTVSNILSSVTASITAGDGALTIATAATVTGTGNTMAAVQLGAGTAGEAYTVTFAVVTSEDPSSTLDVQVRLLVSNQLTL